MANAAGGGMMHGPCRHVAGRRTADHATAATAVSTEDILEHVVAYEQSSFHFCNGQKERLSYSLWQKGTMQALWESIDGNGV